MAFVPAPDSRGSDFSQNSRGSTAAVAFTTRVRQRCVWVTGRSGVSGSRVQPNHAGIGRLLGIDTPLG